MKREFAGLLREKGKTELPRILFASAECAPLSKTGGLADVVGTLPRCLAALGVEASVITPYHRCIKEKYSDRVEHLFHFDVHLGWRREYAGIERLRLDEITYFLVDNERYFGDRIYYGGDAEIEQYAFFTRAILEALPDLPFRPDIIHCNDWHTAMAPMLAKTQYAGKMQEELRYLLAIHNIAFQGKCSIGLAQDLFSLDTIYLGNECLELGGAADFLKAGCVFADRISTVSPSYAEEIRTPYYGEGLNEILNARSSLLTGILNGIDQNLFNPQHDPLLPAHFDRGHLHGKKECKAGLQQCMGLQLRPEVPIFAMVTRMTEQKGFDLLECVLDELMLNEDIQFMLLGTGDIRYENFMRAAEGRYRGRLCAYIGYSEETAHLTYAGSDFFLMPSRFEPCGLGQMIAMRYGCIPIVRKTGGLKDSVISYPDFPEEGNGFLFSDFDAWEMRDAIRSAITCFHEETLMKRLIDSAMRADFSFDKSAEKYLRLYLDML